LKTLADYIRGLADSTDKNILNRLREYLTKIQSDMVVTLQQQMAKSADAPVYWQADVRELIEVNAKAMLKNDAPRLAGWNKDLSLDACMDKARKELSETAQAMEIWPDIWEFCQTNK
ncbi:hypothetical protein MNBD_GAMMA03-898, partial [hydrothermal vent metagenome]